MDMLSTPRYGLLVILINAKLIVEPRNAGKMNFYDYDIELLGEILGLIMEIMGKPSQNIKRNLNLILK